MSTDYIENLSVVTERTRKPLETVRCARIRQTLGGADILPAHIHMHAHTQLTYRKGKDREDLEVLWPTAHATALWTKFRNKQANKKPQENS